MTCFLRNRADHATRTFQRLLELFGWDLDPEKSKGMTESIDVLGCTARIVPQGIQWSLASRKSHDWAIQIHLILERNTLPAGEASKLAGRLNFAMSRVFGRIGRAWIRPLLWRQERKTPEVLHHRLRCALLWWLALLDQ